MPERNLGVVIQIPYKYFNLFLCLILSLLVACMPVLCC